MQGKISYQRAAMYQCQGVPPKGARNMDRPSERVNRLVSLR